jgi:hypothetical protein
MKNTLKTIATLAFITTLIFTACKEDEPADTTDNINKVVEAIYRFSGGAWRYNFFEDVKGAVSALGETTFTVYGGGVSISFTSVYTEGGGIFTNGDRWAYLYNGSGKIGFVTYAGYKKEWTAVIGKSSVDIAKTYYDISAVDTNGMQNTSNGYAIYPGSNEVENKVVETIYRFSGGVWVDANGDIVTGAVSALGETTLKVTGGGVSISFANVYTEYGGMFEGNPWAYLYDGSGKIGFILYISTDNEWIAVVGKTSVDKFKTDLGMNINTDGMQNTRNGYVVKDSNSYDDEDEINYQFSGGGWYDANGDIVTGAASALGGNTFNVTGGGVSISFTSVYTVDGGILYGDRWAYLYDGSGKIGFVLYIKSEKERFAVIGKTLVDKFKTAWSMNINTTGMQNIHNGSTIYLYFQ